MLEALEFHQQALREEAANWRSPPLPYLHVDPYLAASILQKAIRRGEREWALRAARRLLDIDRARLWRRIVITLFEDVGLHSSHLAWRVFGARRACRRAGSADSWPVVALLIREMCDAPKSQAANNALYLALVDPDEIHPLDHLLDQTPKAAVAWVLATDLTLPQRVRAVWMLSGMRLVGSSQPTFHSEASSENVHAVVAEFLVGEDLIGLAQLGVGCGASILAISAALTAYQARLQGKSYLATPDPMPPSQILGHVPSWSLDQYTRSGKAALGSAAFTCPKIRAALETHVSRPSDRVRVLGNVHFEYESACLARRLDLPAERMLLSRTRLASAAPWNEASLPLLAALAQDWTAFVELRKRQFLS